MREAITRGIRNGELRADLPDGALFAMYDALIGRALVLTITGKLTPEQAADSVVSVFLNGGYLKALCDRALPEALYGCGMPGVLSGVRSRWVRLFPIRRSRRDLA